MNNSFDSSNIKANLKKAIPSIPWYRKSFHKKKYESELENREFLSAVYEISKKFSLTNENDKEKFYKVACKYMDIKNISELEGKIICDLVAEDVFLPWLDEKERKLLKIWFKSKNFTAVARTENILKNIFSMHRVQNFDPAKAIRDMKDKYRKSLGNGSTRVLSNLEISQLLNLDLDNFIKEGDLKKIMPFDYENLSDGLKSKIKAEYLFNAIDSYCSGSNMSENDILQSSNNLNKFYYVSQSYAPKFFSKQNAGRYKAIFDNMIKNIDKIHLSLEKVRTDKTKRRDSITNLDIFDTLAKIYGFEKIDGELPVKYKFVGVNDNNKSMELSYFKKGDVFDSERLMGLISYPYKNIESFRKLNFENENLAAVTFLEHPEEIEGISFSILSNTRAKNFWSNVFDFMKLDNRYEAKKQDIVKAIYSLPDTSTLKREFIKSDKTNILAKEIASYFAKDLGIDFNLDLEECFKNNDFKGIVTNKLVLKNILLASHAANQNPLEFIETQKNIYMENHEGKELSNSEIRILLDFDFLNDKQCKKVIPIKTDGLSDEIKNDISGEYILNAFNAYASSMNAFTNDYQNYLTSDPDRRKIFYLASGYEGLFYNTGINEARIKNQIEGIKFNDVIFNQTLENYGDITFYLKEKYDDLGMNEIKVGVVDYIINKNGKDYFSNMFKEKTTILENDEGNKEVDLIDSLDFSQYYINCKRFNELHYSNLKLVSIYVLQNPETISSINIEVQKFHTDFGYKEFSVCLIDTISKQKSYESKITEILSYLDPESEMAKNIVDLAVKKNIYDKIESKPEPDIKKARALTVDLKNKNTEEKSGSLTTKDKKTESDIKKINPLSGKLNNVKKLASFFEGKLNKDIDKQPKKNKGELK